MNAVDTNRRLKAMIASLPERRDRGRHARPRVPRRRRWPTVLLVLVVLAAVVGGVAWRLGYVADTWDDGRDDEPILTHDGALPTTDAPLTSVEVLFVRMLGEADVPVDHHEKHIVQVADAMCGTTAPHHGRVEVARVLFPHWTRDQADRFVVHADHYCRSLTPDEHEHGGMPHG